MLSACRTCSMTKICHSTGPLPSWWCGIERWCWMVSTVRSHSTFFEIIIIMEASMKSSLQFEQVLHMCHQPRCWLCYTEKLADGAIMCQAQITQKRQVRATVITVQACRTSSSQSTAQSPVKWRPRCGCWSLDFMDKIFCGIRKAKAYAVAHTRGFHEHVFVIIAKHGGELGCLELADEDPMCFFFLQLLLSCLNNVPHWCDTNFFFF